MMDNCLQDKYLSVQCQSVKWFFDQKTRSRVFILGYFEVVKTSILFKDASNGRRQLPSSLPAPPLHKTHLCLKESSKVLFTHPIGLHHPLDGVTNPEYKLFRFIQVAIFCK
jgi:hypothetical protein